MDKGHLRHAIIEGVTALELAIGEFIREKLHGADSLRKSMEAFWTLPLTAQIIPIAAVSGKISLQDIEHTIKVIEMRNKVVHEGWNPPDDAWVKLDGLLKTVAALLPGPGFRFPSASPGNELRKLEEWEKQVDNE